MSEIRLRIMGGLGNQLFQYAAARYIQIKYDFDRLGIDKGEYRTYKTRNLEIFNFSLAPCVYEIDNAQIKDRMIKELYHIYQKLYLINKKAFAPMVDFTLGSTRYICSTTEFREPTIKQETNILMYGYFVSATIASLMKKHLMEEITLLDAGGKTYNIYKERILNNRSIGVSVRCGDDYINAGWPICTKQFYVSGINNILSKYPDSRIYIFSDNIKKVKDEKWFNNLPNVQYIENVNVCESFDLLRRCNNFVCANSSFSWWGAFLSYDSSPIIFEPNLFYSESFNDTKRLVYHGVNYLNYMTGEIMNENH